MYKTIYITGSAKRIAKEIALTFISKQPKVSSFVAKGCIGIVTIFSSQLI